MNDVVLHSYRRCPFAIRVRMTLEEKSIAYRVIEEDLSVPSAELLRLHPEGKVPLLIHRGHAIYESAVITEYLEETFPTPSLMPKTPLMRAELRLWTFWCNEIFKPDLDAFKYGLEKLNESEKAALQQRMREHLDKMKSPLTAHAFLLGDELTLADIHLFPFYRQLQRAKPEYSELSRYPQLNDWLARITARPSFDRVMAK